MGNKRWVRRPEGSNWGDFGADDQWGSLNLIGRDQLRAAAAEVRVGRAFCLSLPLDYPGGQVLAPHRRPPQLHSSQRHGRPFFNYTMAAEGGNFQDVASDDAVTLSTQYSTQWDSFAHIGSAFDADGDGVPELCYYNGYRARHDILPPETRPAQPMPLGVERFAERPIQGRGVMLYLDHHVGRAPQVLRMADLRRVLQADGVVVERGDILCVHTGYADEILRMRKAPDAGRVFAMCATLDGYDPELLQWISDSGVAAIATDHYNLERMESAATPRGAHCVPLHQHCLFKRGIPLGELWHLTELAAWLRIQGRSRFLLTAPALRLPGAVGSPVTPVATV